MNGKERRRYRRVPVSGSSMLCSYDSTRSANLSIIRDMSEGGMSFSSMDNICVGTIVNFKFVAPGKRNRIVEGTGEIIWKNIFRGTQEGYHLFWYGLRFQNLDYEQQNTIRSLVKRSGSGEQ